ncbi:hypothetical protein OG194_19620 [Streptomyces sp. NBC_01288]|nr:hypothetical protein OG194_19620 [Streptomyces sp. NBC_01288]
MILPLMVDAAGIFIMKQFFEAIPREVEEASRVDFQRYFVQDANAGAVKE